MVSELIALVIQILTRSAAALSVAAQAAAHVGWILQSVWVEAIKHQRFPE